MNAKETSHRQFMIGCDTQYLKESLGSSSVLFIFFLGSYVYNENP